ncbi:hypothetical protein HRbin29_00993 [bacterium HR29]|nr:hypothetical protein HRbin29_00993 [bacterium HR29]
MDTSRDPRLNLARWVPDELPPAGQWRALVRLAAAVRQVIDILSDTEASEADLDAAAEQVERVAAELGELPRGRRLWGFAETATSDSPKAMFDNSPIIGMANPVAPPLRLRVENGRVVGTAIYGQAYEGPPGHLHGGWVAASFDEVLGMAQTLSGKPGMTGTLTVRYRSPTPLHQEVRFEGWIERVEGRKIFTRGTLHAGGTLCAEAEGIFVSVDWERFRSLADRRAATS